MKKYNENSNVLGCQKCPNYIGNYVKSKKIVQIM